MLVSSSTSSERPDPVEEDESSSSENSSEIRHFFQTVRDQFTHARADPQEPADALGSRETDSQTEAEAEDIDIDDDQVPEQRPMLMRTYPPVVEEDGTLSIPEPELVEFASYEEML